MTHENARELLLDLAYGELSPAEARAVEAHLAGCEACRAERDRMTATRRLMQGLGEEEPPGGEGILMAAARQAAERPRRAPLFSWVRLATGLAVLMVVGGVTMELLSARRPAVDDAEERYAARGAPAQAPGLVLEAAPVQGAPAETPAPPAPAARGPAKPAPAAAPSHAAAPPPPRAREERRARTSDAGASVLAGEARAPEPTDLAIPAPGVAGPVPEDALAKPRARAVAGKVDTAPASPQAVTSLREAAPAAGFAKGAAVPAEAEAPAASRATAAGAEQAQPARDAARKVARVDAAAADGAALVAEITRLRDEGLLNEARRRPEPCPGGDTARLAWFDGLGTARRFSRTGPLPAGMGAGEAIRDQWYDGQGRLRYAVVEGQGPQGRFRRRILLDPSGAVRSEDPPGGAPWPRGDLALADPAGAFWAPQRCTGR